MARIVQERLSAATNMQVDPESPLNYAALATQTEGYSATDLQDLVARAVHQLAVRSSDGSKPVGVSRTPRKLCLALWNLAPPRFDGL